MIWGINSDFRGLGSFPLGVNQFQPYGEGEVIHYYFTMNALNYIFNSNISPSVYLSFEALQATWSELHGRGAPADFL